MTLIDDMVALYKAERKSLLHQIEMMESGELTTHSKDATSALMVDTTPDSIANAKQHLAQIEAVLARHPEKR